MGKLGEHRMQGCMMKPATQSEGQGHRESPWQSERIKAESGSKDENQDLVSVLTPLDLPVLLVANSFHLRVLCGPCVKSSSVAVERGVATSIKIATIV